MNLQIAKREQEGEGRWWSGWCRRHRPSQQSSYKELAHYLYVTKVCFLDDFSFYAHDNIILFYKNEGVENMCSCHVVECSLPNHGEFARTSLSLGTSTKKDCRTEACHHEIEQ